MVKKLLHTRMRVNDLERTVKFYEEVLGLKVRPEAHVAARGASSPSSARRTATRRSSSASFRTARRSRSSRT